MSKSDENKRMFQSGKELLDKCIYKLNENQKGEAGGNVAKHPVVVIMMGEKSRVFTKYIKNTLDDNWNNARFLQYLNVVKEGEQFYCYSLKEAENDELLQWNLNADNFEDQLNKAIVEMLEADEKIFQDRNSVKLEYVLDATEADGKEYVDLYRKINSHLHSKELKTLFLMIDQRPANNNANDSDKLLQYIVENRNENMGTVYLLSNYLKSGRMLGEKYIFENYRLIANIILLGGNRGGSVSYKQNLYNGIKTVSYALVTKPTDEIAAVALQTMLAHIYEEEKSNNLSKEMTEKEVRERLKFDQYNGIELAEKIFKEKIEYKFPMAESFLYLPFQSEKDCKECMKDTRISIRELDFRTYGAASSFIRVNYEELVEQLFEDSEKVAECREQIRQEVQNSFDFFDFRNLDNGRNIVKSLMSTEYHSGGSGARDDFALNIHNRAVYKCKKVFYERIYSLYEDVIYELVDSASRLDSIYEECEKEIQKEWIVTGDESESVEKVYKNLVKEFVRSQKKVNEHCSIFPSVFNPDNTKEDLLQEFWNIFCSLVKLKEFSYDFEQEVDFRMDSMNETQRHEFTNELQEKLDGSIRLRNAIDVETMRMSCYYLINESADYANNLKQADGNGTEYTLFDLNRTDCIEQLEIYNIIKPELLHLTNGGRNNED